MLNEALKSRLGSDSAIAELVQDRIHPTLTPEPGGNPPAYFPAITFKYVSGQREHCLEAPPGVARPRMQIDAWSNDSDGAMALADAIRKSLDGFRGVIGDVPIISALLDTWRGADYEPASKVYKVESEYLILHRE